jgi:adenosylhomocysteine nucleosidase
MGDQTGGTDGIRGRLGFVTGLQMEADLIRKAARALRLEPPPIAVAGPGALRPDATLDLLMAQGATAVASLGLAGALAPALKAGTVVIPAEVHERETGKRLPVDVQWRALIGMVQTTDVTLRDGPIVSSRTPLLSAADKALLHRASGGHAVDMESYAVALEAARRGLPFVAIRAISDTADTAIPEAAARAMTADGRLTLTPILMAIIRRQETVAAFRELGRQSALATKALRRVLERTLPRLEG